MEFTQKEKEQIMDNNMEKEKIILDACCGGRMMWFNKKQPNTIYQDIREEEKGFIKGAEFYSVIPDIIQAFYIHTFTQIFKHASADNGCRIRVT